ncbi:aspartyl-phosphate phosphatase Spo0E family protein [Alteribacillus bidgolensis]|uniref:Spo0E like sporulation regulatory protein n=1 Tax=Alteribacillus bidgolensis TaxID=930129 RepID=A0A1G8RKM5_9BACI|nr:aspartyl-phosphate phosphatase Spo0E family protein [Alteribacillus bidgolensis]SDJ17511.1 Spo0E like sporulation regulatory protein [Alteribacillus bidgolensis]
MYNKDELEERINDLRKELIQSVEKNGLNSHETIRCSQKLDQLIKVYQKKIIKTKNRN